VPLITVKVIVNSFCGEPQPRGWGALWLAVSQPYSKLAFAGEIVIPLHVIHSEKAARTKRRRALRDITAYHTGLGVASAD
jgi:hypothetical protein